MVGNRDKLMEALKTLSIRLNEKQVDQLMEYYEILIEWNKVMNLTAITEFEDVVSKHFIDSLSLCEYIDLSKEYRIIDIGTGAGFPGIPLKIAFPNLEVTLLDSLNKRIKFLDEVINKLDLTNIKAIHGRAEDIAIQQEHRQNYDIAVSRAVAGLNILSEYCMPFVKVGGMFIPYKSGEIEDELQTAKKAITTFGGQVQKVEYFMLPNTEIKRTFVMIEKMKETPKRYPRNAGKPSKEPII